MTLAWLLVGGAVLLVLAVLARRRQILNTPDLCDRWRAAWAIPNDQIRGQR